MNKLTKSMEVYNHEKFKKLSIECQHSYAAMNGRCSFCNKQTRTCMGAGICICLECAEIAVADLKAVCYHCGRTRPKSLLKLNDDLYFCADDIECKSYKDNC